MLIIKLHSPSVHRVDRTNYLPDTMNNIHHLNIGMGIYYLLET